MVFCGVLGDILGCFRGLFWGILIFLVTRLLKVIFGALLVVLFVLDMLVVRFIALHDFF